MRVVIAPQHVAVPGRVDDLHGALVVLERRVDLLVDDLAGQPAQLGPHEHAVLAVGLVHPVPDRGHPAGAALGDEDLQAGVAVQGPAGDQVRHDPHARIGRLHVVDDGAAGPAEDHGVPAGADVEAEHDACPLGGGPQRLPAVQRVLLARPGLAGQEHGLEAQPGGALQLGDGVIDVGRGDAGGGDDPLVLAQDLGVRPVVPGPHGLPGQLPVGDLDRPEPHRREGELAPDAFLVEVLQPDAEVPGARGPHGVHEVVELAVDPLPVDVEHSRTYRRARCAAPARPAWAGGPAATGQLAPARVSPRNSPRSWSWCPPAAHRTRCPASGMETALASPESDWYKEFTYLPVLRVGFRTGKRSPR